MRKLWTILVALVGLWQVALAGLPLPKELATRKVDLLVSPEGLSLEDALRALSKTLGVPIFFRELPRDELTISLKDRTLKETLDLLSRVYGDEVDYTWLPEKAILVAPKRIVEVMAPAPEEEPKQEKKEEEKTPKEYISQAFSAPGLEKDFLGELKALLPNTAFAYSASSGVLLLSGPPEEIARISPLLRSLEKKEALEVVPVSSPIDGDKLASVAQALGAKALLVGDRVLLKGEKEALEKLEEILKSPSALAPERKKEEEPTLFQVFTIPKGREDALASALQDLLPVKAATLAPGQLVVKGPKEAIAQAQALIASIPPEEPKEERAPPVLKVVTVPKGRAEALKASLGELLDLKVSPLGEDALILLGPKEAIAQAEALLSALPEEALKKTEKEEEGLPVKAYPIYGDPAGVEKALSAAFPKGGFTVVPEAKRVVVRGPYELHEKVVTLLKEVDPPRPEEKKEEEKEAQAEIPLFHLSPDEAQSYLKELGVPVKVVKNPAGNQIWLLGKEKDVAQAVNLLQEADRAAPQIRLRVRVVRTSKGGLDELKSSLGTVLDNLRLDLGGSGFSGTFTLPVDLLRTLELKLGALENKSEAKTLINTEVILKDGETAKLTSGGTLTAGLNAPAGEGKEGERMAAPAPTSFDYGLSIEFKGKVVPNEDRAVDLSVAINLGEPPVPGPIANSIQIAKRTLTTNLRIKDGQGVLLGGLIQETKSVEESGVPILSWIPIIGDLFKTKKDTVQEEGLLIILEGQVEGAPTLLPKIVKPAVPKGENTPPSEALTDPRTPPTPPAPKPSPTEGQNASESNPLAQAKLAPWARLEASLREGNLIAYVISTSKTAPIFRVVSAYTQEMDGRFTTLTPKGHKEWITPGKADLITFPNASFQNPYDLTLLLEDELGGRWYVRSTVSLH